MSLVGRLPGDLPDTDEIWGCNFAYQNHVLDRLYAMDAPEWFRENVPKWFGDADSLGIPVFMKEPVSDIALSTAFDRTAMWRTFGCSFYHEATVSYILADAICEGFGTIFLHRMVESALSIEYYDQKTCLDWWAAFASGLGIRVVVSEDSLIGRPHPWCSGEYGYVTKPETDEAQQILADALRDILTGRK